MNKRQILLVLVLLLIVGRTKLSFSQDSTSKEYPVSGEPCPDFLLTDIHNMPEKEIRLSDFKGRYVILDFWNAGCVACIASFPEINNWQKKYKDRLDIILIGQDYKGYGKIEETFEKYREKYELEFTSAYDNELFDTFRVRGVPLYIWIDKDGQVVAVTNSSALKEENLERFLNDEDFGFVDVSYDRITGTKERYNPELPFLIDKNGGAADDDFLFRSVLSEWKQGMANYRPMDIDSWLWESRKTNHPKFEILQHYLTMLYKLAYSGTWTKQEGHWFHPILELKDSADFRYDKFYCYSVITPEEKATKNNLMRIMQNDLNSYFGHHVVFEQREMPCWRIYADEKTRKKLKSKGGEKIVEWSNTGYRVKNASMSEIIHGIEVNQSVEFLMYDYTGFSVGETVDFNLDALMLDWEDVIEKFGELGLKIVPARQELTVLVIRDSPNT